MSDLLYKKNRIIVICIVFLTITIPIRTNAPNINSDQPLILPDWNDDSYHDYEKTTKLITDFERDYPDLVEVFSIGKSVQLRDIWCIKITNEKSGSQKNSCLIDGCIHGDEWEAGEACLYLAEYLLINFQNNKSIKKILNKTTVYIVPLLNPDGREKNIRWNANGIDLNRNYDAHFGRILAGCFRLGKLFGKIIIPGFYIPKIGLFSNCGRYPFSEPETKALNDFMKTIDTKTFSFYINCHTALHCIAGTSVEPFFPEYRVSSQEKKVINSVKDWVGNNTEYRSYYSNRRGFGSGSATQWFFKEFKVPSFTFEILKVEYDPYIGEKKHDHLVHWMNTTLPVFMFLLTNSEYLLNWEIPAKNPVLPKGVPPPPI